MNVGIINALPMSLVNVPTTLIPNHVKLEKLINKDNLLMWLWGHKNSSDKALEFLEHNYNVHAVYCGFGDRPTIIAKDKGLFVKTITGGMMEIDYLVVLAPKFGGFTERKAEGEIAIVSEIESFTPILVVQ